MNDLHESETVVERLVQMFGAVSMKLATSLDTVGIHGPHKERLDTGTGESRFTEPHIELRFEAKPLVHGYGNGSFNCGGSVPGLWAGVSISITPTNMSDKNVQVSQDVARTLFAALYSFKRRMQDRDEWCGRVLNSKVYRDIDAAFKELRPQTKPVSKGSSKSQ